MVAFENGKQISNVKTNERKYHITKENAAEIGRKGGSVCKGPLDDQCRAYLDQYLAQHIKEGDERPRLWIMIEAAFKAWLQGNYGPMKFLVERGYGKTPDVFKVEYVPKHEVDMEIVRKRLSKDELKTFIKLVEKINS